MKETERIRIDPTNPEEEVISYGAAIFLSTLDGRREKGFRPFLI